MNSDIYAFIFARGGSKGLKNKNILNLGNKPLIAHSIEIAKELKEVKRIFVSTDSKEIASIGNKYGAEIIIRPDELATDKSSEWLSWQHAISLVENKYGKFENFLSLPPTSPLRSLEDIKGCIKALTNDVDLVLTITKSRRSPWFNMVINNNDNYLKLIIENMNIKRRQDAPEVFDICTAAYYAKTSFILNSNSIWEGIIRGFEIPLERSIDIDNKYDFDIATYLHNKQT